MKTNLVMKFPPYSLSEAKKICSEFQWLLGQKFSADNETLIDSVVIAPFDEINQKRFVIYYMLFEDAQMALAHEYKGLLFDVLVMAGLSEEGDMLFEDISMWLSHNKQYARTIALQQAKAYEKLAGVPAIAQ